MHYAIMRVKKYNTAGGIVRAAKHNLREADVTNADPAKTAANQYFLSANSGQVLERLRSRLALVDRKVREGSVLAVELLVTTSPDWEEKKKGDRTAYFNKAIEWAKEKFGPENLLSVTLHKDEKTPHLHIMLTPIKEKVNKKGKTVTSLCAKDWLGGRKVMSDLQSEFYEKSGAEGFGLERGVRRSGAKHQEVKRYYGMLKTPVLDTMALPEKRTLESKEKYAERVTEAVNQQATVAFTSIRTLADNATKERDEAREKQHNAELDRRRAGELGLKYKAEYERISDINKKHQDMLLAMRDGTPEQAVQALRELRGERPDQSRGR